MSLAQKRALADQLRGELSQLRVEKEAALHDTSAAAAEAQVDAEIQRLVEERNQALLELEMARNGGSVEEAMAAMNAAAEQETSGFESHVDETEDKGSNSQPFEVPGLIEQSGNQDGGTE